LEELAVLSAIGTATLRAFLRPVLWQIVCQF
jgi:hypothetical protein